MPTFTLYQIYEFKATAYECDPSTVESWKNERKDFDVTILAKTLEEALVLCREFAKEVAIRRTSYDNYSVGNFCEIKSVVSRGSAYLHQ